MQVNGSLILKTMSPPPPQFASAAAAAAAARDSQTSVSPRHYRVGLL